LRISFWFGEARYTLGCQPKEPLITRDLHTSIEAADFPAEEEIMNLTQIPTNEISELSDAELDQVCGGLFDTTILNQTNLSIQVSGFSGGNTTQGALGANFLSSPIAFII
jgi:hypothetical protein